MPHKKLACIVDDPEMEDNDGLLQEEEQSEEDAVCLVASSSLSYLSKITFVRIQSAVCVQWENRWAGNHLASSSSSFVKERKGEGSRKEDEEEETKMVLPLAFLISAEREETETPTRLNLVFENAFELRLVFPSPQKVLAFERSLRLNAIEGLPNTTSASPSASFAEKDPLLLLQFNLTVAKERSLMLAREAAARERLAFLDSKLWSQRLSLLSSAFNKWIASACALKQTEMERDKQRWGLHAQASVDSDLQAWYHHSFHEEIFHLKIRFWMNESQLPRYKHSNRLIANKLTKYEEAALAHVLCTPDTTYGDVASHMFVIQSTVSPALYAVFEEVCSKGISVTKFPRNGSPGTIVLLEA